MSDLLRVVSVSAGGRPVEILNIEDGVNYFQLEDGVKIAPPAKAPQLSQLGGRYGGSIAVGEAQDNGQLDVSIVVIGSSYDNAVSKADQLLATVDDAARGRFLEFRPMSASRSRLFELRGPGSYVPQYDPLLFEQQKAWQFDLSWPVAPLVRRLPLDVFDDFSFDTTGDYSFDAGAGTLNWSSTLGGKLVSSSTVEKRLRHTARGYSYEDVQVTARVITGAATAGIRFGPRLKWIDDSNYLRVFVDGNSIVIGKVDGGATTTLAAVAFALAANTTYWVRGRIEGNVVFAEAFTSQPSPMVAPAASTSFTLTGGDLAKFGAGVAGQVGLRILPAGIDERYDDFEVLAYVYRNQTLPNKIQLGGPIPGDAPALVDVEVAPSGGAAAPVWAMLALDQRPAAPVSGIAPFAVFEAETASDLAGWVSGADGDASGGTSILDATPTSAETYNASWSIDPTALQPDDFSGEVVLEVWARVRLGASLVSPKLTLSARTNSGVGAERFAEPYGTQGKLLVVPSSGAARRFVPLGLVSLPCDPDHRATWKLFLTGSLGAGSGGSDWAIDRLIVLPARSRASGPTAKPNDSSFPDFVSTTAETRKRILSDRRGLVATASSEFVTDAGLSSGANRIEAQPGNNDLLVKLSSLVPDDPTVDATTEQLNHSATVHAAVWPRDFLTGS